MMDVTAMHRRLLTTLEVIRTLHWPGPCTANEPYRPSAFAKKRVGERSLDEQYEAELRCRRRG